MMWNFKKYHNRLAAIADDGSKISYKKLEVAIAGVSDNISERCLVFSLCENSIGSLIGYTSFINNHIVPLLLDKNIDSDLLESLILSYKPSYLWVPDSMLKMFSEYERVYCSNCYTLLRTGFEEQYALHNELALLLSTSGSTGSPKLVRQSYKNISANIKSIVEYLEISEQERPITTLPMNYTYGLSILNTHLYVGATLLLTDKSLMEKEFWNFLKSQKATSFAGVPYTYEMLDRLRVFRMKLPELKIMTQAGGKLSPKLHKKFAEYAEESGMRFIVMYGQTEATARMSYLPHNNSIDKYGSVGYAIPGGKFSLIDTKGNEINESDVAGELVYQGANVTLGYAEKGDDLIKGDDRQGILHTGDIAKRDGEGYYYIVGRKKRFLKIFGNRISLDETERMIKDQMPNMECACTGKDDKMNIFITDNTATDAVKRCVIEKTGLHFSAFNIVSIDEVPKNEAGKILYSQLDTY